MSISYSCQHTFLSDTLGPGSVVLDCGANRGVFSDFVSSNFSCRVFGYEAHPDLYSKLQPSDRCQFFNLAVIARGEKTFLKINSSGQSACSVVFSCKESSNIEVGGTSIDQILKDNDLRQVDLLKLDIEGAELEVLANIEAATLAKIGQITCEFHDFIDQRQVKDIKEIIKKLRDNNFFVARISLRNHSDVVALNRDYYRVDKFLMLRIFAFKWRKVAVRAIEKIFWR